ncbi:MAG: lysylphosphatidylglycerol synthase transmembrane domain-containing protein [Pseudomonadota bacterium]
MIEPARGARPEGPFWSRFRAWLLGLLVLSGLILLVTHFGELEHFVQLLRQAEPAWLLLAALLQLATYLCVASVWYLALRRAGQRRSLLSLVPLGVAKLFSDQAMPSGGMSGTAFFITALSRRGIPTRVCMATLLLSLVSYYGAYLLAALVTVLLLSFYHALQLWNIVAVVVFVLVAVGIPAGALWLRSLARRELPVQLLRIPGLGKLMDAIAQAPDELLRSPALVAAALLCHGAVFLLDAATLQVMLQVVGMPATLQLVFPCFMLAAMVATVGPIPLGLGTFEVTCVSMLGALGVPVEAALAATLLLRGFTLWLPMFPGMWLARRALR